MAMTARPSRLQRHRDDGHRGCLRQRGLAGPQFKWAGYQIVLPSRSGAEGRPAEGERLAHLPDRIGKPACERKQTLSTSKPGGCAGAAGSEGVARAPEIDLLCRGNRPKLSIQARLCLTLRAGLCPVTLW
eukprot:scaffold54311_cov63-Phaeocystis_antarctica.AAC.3